MTESINQGSTIIINQNYSDINNEYPRQFVATTQSMDELFEYIEDRNNSDAPDIDIPTVSLSPAQQMLVFQKLSSLIEDSLIKSSKSQLEALQNVNKKQLEDSLIKLNEMVAKNAERKSAERRSKIFGWISRIAVLVVSAAVLGAVVVGSAGLAAGPAFVAVTALLSLFGAAYDVAGQAQKEIDGKGFTLGEHVGSEIGAAALTANFGALAGLSLQKAGNVPDWAVIVVSVAVTLAQMAITMKCTVAPEKAVKFFARLTDIAQKIGLSVNGLSLTLQGATQIDQAELAKSLNHIHYLMVNQEAELTKIQEQINQKMSFVEEFQQGLQSMTRIATEAVSEIGRNMKVLSDLPSDRFSAA